MDLVYSFQLNNEIKHSPRQYIPDFQSLKQKAKQVLNLYLYPDHFIRIYFGSQIRLSDNIEVTNDTEFKMIQAQKIQSRERQEILFRIGIDNPLAMGMMPPNLPGNFMQAHEIGGFIPEISEPNQTNIQAWSVIKNLGSGGFGKVDLMKHHKTRECLAVKYAFNRNDRDNPGVAAKENESVRQELKLLWSLSHLNVIKFHYYAIEQGRLYVMMEYCEGGSIEDKIKDSPLSINLTRKYSKQILSAIRYLHSRTPHKQPIVHRDIKPANCLIVPPDRIKLSDFGLARTHKPFLDISSEHGKGTPNFLAPENIYQAIKSFNDTDEEKRFNFINSESHLISEAIKSHHNLYYMFASDIWAFAITILAMLTRETLLPRSIGAEDWQRFLMSSEDALILQSRRLLQRHRIYPGPASFDIFEVFNVCLILNPKQRADAVGELRKFL